MLSGAAIRMIHRALLPGSLASQCLVWLLVTAGLCQTTRAETPEVAAAIQAIKRLGGKVRWQGQAWEVDFHLRGRELTDEDLVHVSKLKQVEYLNLGRTQIRGPGLRHLKTLSKLRRLHLEQTAVDDAGIAQLAGMHSLEYLNVFGTQVTDRSLQVLAQLPELQQVYVWQTAVTAEGVAALQKRRPQMKIIRGTDLSSLPETFPKTSAAMPPKLALKWSEVSARDEAPTRSENGINVQVWFENQSTQTVKLYWIGYGAGELKLYAKLAPGAKRQQNSYSRNVWLITSQAEQPLGYFVVEEDDARAVIPGETLKDPVNGG